MNKNSNTYQIVYSAIMVVLVGAALAFVYMALKPKQDENIANDKRQQILSAVHITAPSDKEVKNTFEKYITEDFIVNEKGEVVDSTKGSAFTVDMKSNIKLTGANRKLPVFKCTLDNGEIKYIFPVFGAGLWGAIWGYVAVNADGSNVYGAYFSHESETPGLGAEIAKQPFQDQFKGKALYKDGQFKSIDVLKAGQKNTDGADYVNAISGGTITSRGVQAMLKNCLSLYDAYFKKLQSETTNNKN
jgi:Na+-transporting NADH:ubiquinone oxidoreductase subunit C